MDVIARLPGCDGQAADAVSAKTQVKVENDHRLLKKFQNRNVQTCGYVFHDTHGKNQRNLYGHPLAGLLRVRQFEEASLELVLGKIQDWECLFVHRKQGLVLSVCVDDIK